MKEYIVDSKTDSTKRYTLRHFPETGVWACTCPSYVWGGEGFECKHIREKKKELGIK